MMNKTLKNIIIGTAFYGSLIGVMSYKFTNDVNLIKNSIEEKVGNETIYLQKKDNSLDIKCINPNYELPLPRLKPVIEYVPLNRDRKERAYVMVGFEFDKKEFEDYKKIINKKTIIDSFEFYKDNKRVMCGDGSIGSSMSINSYDSIWKEHSYQAIVKFTNGKKIKSDKIVFTQKGFEYLK